MKNILEMLKAYKVTSKYSSIKIIRLNKLDDWCDFECLRATKQSASVSSRCSSKFVLKKIRVRYEAVKLRLEA